MLVYLVNTTEDLLIAAVITGVALSYALTRCAKPAYRITVLGVLAGILGSIVVSVLRNATTAINAGLYTMGLFTISLVAMVVFFVFVGRSSKPDAKGVVRMISSTALAVVVATTIMYALPTVFGYPVEILMAEGTAFSTEFLFKMIGWAAGIAIDIVAALAVNRACSRIGSGLVSKVLVAMLAVNGVFQATSILQTMLARRMIESNHTLFMIAKVSSNYEIAFTIAVLVLGAIIPIALWMRSFRVHESYRNAAERRKIKAKWRTIRRWSTAALAFFVVAMINLTVVDAIANAEVTLSPIEDSVVEGEYVKVAMDAVDDGHLHRFAYVTDSGTQERFIIVKKPNSSSFGVGMDCCDVCGETGYFEREGQVVCKKCDVVMNINTIGFKGGCNPKVVDWKIENGYICVSVESILQYEGDFGTGYYQTAGGK